MPSIKKIPELLRKIIPPMECYDYFEAEAEAPFNSQSDELSLANAWHLAEASLVVYEEPNVCRNIYRLRGYEGFQFFNNHSTEAFVAWKDKHAIVSFRGTEVKSFRTILDIYTDAKFARTELLSGFVHKGFKDGVMNIWEGQVKPIAGYPWMNSGGLFSFLSQLKAEKPDMNFFFTGHSLGGAMATIAACLFPSTKALYTYGCPMVGDQDFASHVTFPHYRWVNDRDAITMLPPKEIMEKVVKYSYVHCGKELFLDRDGRLATAPANRNFLAMMAGDFDKIMESLAGAFSSMDKFKEMINRARGKESVDEKPIVDAFIDHAPVNYPVKIWNLMCS